MPGEPMTTDNKWLGMWLTGIGVIMTVSAVWIKYGFAAAVLIVGIILVLLGLAAIRGSDTPG